VLPFTDNLALRAANLLRARAGVSAGAGLLLRKRIPIAAGLGGGSADAAAALLGLQHLWSVTTLDLAPLAAELGSDVPFFLGGPTALVQGRGERLEPLPCQPPRPLILVRPRTPLSTRDVFNALRADEWTDGSRSHHVARVMAAGGTVPEDLLTNGLLTAAERCLPLLTALRRSLEAIGLRPLLSGSGPTFFLLTGDAEAWSAILEAVGDFDADVLRCNTLNSAPLQLHAET